MMMEEVSDDTNGDSTFEFLGDTPATAPTANVTTSLTNAMQNVPSVPNPIPTAPVMPVSSDLPPPQSIPSFIPIPQGSPPPPPMPNPYHQGFQHTSTTSSSSSGPICSAPQPVFMTPAPPALTATVDLSMVDPYQSASLPQHQSRGDSSGVWGWFKGSDILNKMAEKAKSSVDSMITTLDPGMKEYIYSGGNVDLVVASSDEDHEVSPVRDTFQTIFGRATVTGIPSRPQNIAAQPVGFAVALQGAEECISYLRQGGQVHQQQAILAIQNFLVELTPDRWFEMSCLLLQDPVNSTNLQTYTQPLPVPLESVMQAQEQTPSDYPLRWSGLAVTVRKDHTGISSRELIVMASRALANMYKQRLHQQYI